MDHPEAGRSATEDATKPPNLSPSVPPETVTELSESQFGIVIWNQMQVEVLSPRPLHFGSFAHSIVQNLQK